MKNKISYYILTYRFRLFCEQKEWLVQTNEMYNQVLAFYYEVLKAETTLSELTSKQQILRQLELLTIGARGQSKSEVKYPLPYKKVPLYFRRAAANDAIRLWKSQTVCKKTSEESMVRIPREANLYASPIFYKGMYKELTSESICLKLWNGSKWQWITCGLDTCGRVLPEADKLMSPILKVEKKRTMLHIPVKEIVEDARTVEERVCTEEKICTAVFPNNDCLAVLTILNRNGKCENSLFIREGKELAHQKKKLLNRMKKNRESMGIDGQYGDLKENTNMAEEYLLEENKHIKEKIRNINDTYAHKVSRQIVNFCKEHQVKLLVVPNYHYTMNLNQIGYLSATSYDWIGRRIIEYTRYKAFVEGIVVTSVPTKDTMSSCHICGEKINRYNKDNTPNPNYYGGKNYICPNGHRGNSYFNAAINIGKKFLKAYPETER